MGWGGVGWRGLRVDECEVGVWWGWGMVRVEWAEGGVGCGRGGVRVGWGEAVTQLPQFCWLKLLCARRAVSSPVEE